MLDLTTRFAAEPPPVLPAGRGVHIWRTAVVMPLITFVFVALRFYARRVVLTRALALDDYVVAATMVAIIVHAVLMAQATRHGMGLHIWEYTRELNSEYYLWIGISSMFYVLSLAGFKSALLLLYLQLFGVNRKFRIACYIALFYTLGYLTCNLLTEFLGCNPIQKKWHSELPGKCINTIAANIAYGAGHMTSDLIIGILPLVMVWRLQFPTRRQKLGLSLALGSGLLAWAVACVRWGISTYNMLSDDRPWWAGISFLFSILEVNTGLICACMATLSPLSHLLDWGRTWTSNLKSSLKSSVRRPSGNDDTLELGRAPTRRATGGGAAHIAGHGSAGESNDSLHSSLDSSLDSRPWSAELTPYDVSSSAVPGTRNSGSFAPYDLQGLQAITAGAGKPEQ
ncbi:hypothetical protein DL770_008075 [Monosporascus sp. CRB-9-2]|nr:hypothetical protein DL770_008075 [Monosporascus sp. CRB-9-2]